MNVDFVFSLANVPKPEQNLSKKKIWQFICVLLDGGAVLAPTFISNAFAHAFAAYEVFFAAFDGFSIITVVIIK